MVAFSLTYSNANQTGNNMANSDYNQQLSGTDNCDMAQEIKDARKQMDSEIPMPNETTTDKLMRPGSAEVEG